MELGKDKKGKDLGKMYLVKWQGYELNIGDCKGVTGKGKGKGKGVKGDWEPLGSVYDCQPFKVWTEAQAARKRARHV